ncbi:MAG: phosphorylase [Alphaproteobacteria bacterium]|nr:phosphorylase [Alphaproteobacteria bacterium]MDE2111556.1 phosphorylase [Alphaproteobacteria bacterium]MDE2495000.1 phosphorylase [Alphaproteobacteria bacterium]
MSILAATGLAKEARIAKRVGLKPAIGGGSSELLTKRLDEAADGATAIVSFGIAGALAPLLRTGDAVIGTHVVAGNEHYTCDAAWSQILRSKLAYSRPAIIAGVDEVVSHIGAKRALFRDSGAHAVDMESHIAARFAKQHSLPFVVLRIISDGYQRTLPPAALEPLKPNGKPRLLAVLKSVAGDPEQIPELIQTGQEAGKAFRALLRCSRLIGFGLGCPYLG